MRGLVVDLFAGGGGASTGSGSWPTFFVLGVLIGGVFGLGYLVGSLRPARFAECKGRGGCNDCDDEPEPPPSARSVCTWCDSMFEGTGDDCGGCRLSDEQCEEYSRKAVRP